MIEGPRKRIEKIFSWMIKSIVLLDSIFHVIEATVE